MKKLLGLLGTIMITGNSIPSVIAAAPNRKHSIKKRQNNENTLTTPKTKDDEQPQFSTTSDSKVDIIEKEIILDENYSDNIQKILKELIKNNQLDPLRMINNEGIVRTDYFETQDKRNERESNIKIIEKLEKILELRKFNENKIRILILTLKNKDNNEIKLIINLDNFYLQGFINKNNQYFYFKEEKILDQWKQEIKNLTEELKKWQKIKEEIKLLDLEKLNNNKNIIEEIDKNKENLKKELSKNYKENKEKIDFLNKNLFNQIQINNQDSGNINKLNELKEKVEILKKNIYIGQIQEKLNVYQKIQQIRQNTLSLLNKGKMKSEIKKGEYEENIKNYRWDNVFNEINSIIESKINTIQHKKIKENKINEKIIKKYLINENKKHMLNYNGSYQNKGLNAVNQNIIISQNSLNNAISNLSKFNNDNKQNQTIKDDLTQTIFITSEFIRFGSYLKYFNYEKNDKQVEFKNIPEDIQNIINSTNDDKIKWKDYSEQLIGGWVAASKYSEEKRKEIFKSLDINMSYYEILSNISSNKNDYEKLNFEFNLPSNNEEMINLMKYCLNDNNFDDKKLREKLKIKEKYVAAIEIIKNQIKQLNNNKYISYLSNYEKKIMDLIKNKIIDNYKMNIIISNEEIRRKQIPVSSKNVKLFGNNKFSNFENNFLHLVYIDSIEIKNGETKRNKDILELLLMKGANINSKNDELGITLLHIAVYNEELDIVGLLLDYGVDVNIQDKNGETALHKTIMNKNLEKTEKLNILKLLLNHPKINVNLGDNNGETALHRAVKLNNLKIVNELLTNPNSKDYIFINALNIDKSTPLHYAAYNGNFKIVKLLIANGADVNISNSFYKKPINFCKKIEVQNILKKFEELKKLLDSTKNEIQKKNKLKIK